MKKNKKKVFLTNRYAKIHRITKETDVKIKIWLDKKKKSIISTGIHFFDHMLYQVFFHSGITVKMVVKGDLYIDDHHTVEDSALSLGKVFKKALGKKIGISRFGFVLPMDECLASCFIDISNRSYLKYKAKYKFQYIGDLNTEMISHFFYSFSHSMGCSIHLCAKGKNDHHKAESLFKVFGKTLEKAIRIKNKKLPSSKGIL